MDGLDAMLENGPWFIQNNMLILKKWHPDENLLKEDVSTIPVWVKLYGVPVTAFSEDGLSGIATKLADMELKDNIVVVMPKITREGHYTCNVSVEYEWKPPRCSSCKVFGHIHEECPKNTGAGEKKTVKKPSQTSRGVPVGPKIGFKPQKEYRPVPKKSTTSSSGNKKKGVEPTIEVSNSNTFDVLNSFNNDMEFGTNRGTTNLVNNGATLSGSSFMNVDNSSSGTTLIIDKIGKFKDLLTSGQAILVDKAGNPLKKVEFPGEYDSEDEVASVDNDMARSMASERVGFGTQSLLEQWRDSYGNGDYDDAPYDDDMYEGQDLSHELQAICDYLDIRCNSSRQVEKKANLVEVEDEYELTLLMAKHDEQEERIEPWHIDSAASNHMTGEEDLFVEMEKGKGNVTFGDESKALVKGKGKILIRAKDGSHQYILDVYNVPNLKSNILSMEQLLEKNYDIHFKDRSATIRNQEGKLIAKVPEHST
ncbi:RNA-directed DNA polymerase, eukaryota, reverse transcriptase zinc-binding domain protein [Tanacetum coccineum]